jgi:hypothetical protein
VRYTGATDGAYPRLMYLSRYSRPRVETRRRPKYRPPFDERRLRREERRPRFDERRLERLDERRLERRATAVRLLFLREDFRRRGLISTSVASISMVRTDFRRVPLFAFDVRAADFRLDFRLLFLPKIRS